jgi:hypothetical protein
MAHQLQDIENKKLLEKKGYCDASKNGLGCVLMQDRKVIAYG